MSRGLIIEPDRMLAQTYGQALENASHEVLLASGAQAGMRPAEEFQPDLVVLELQLIAHSGIEFLYEFRSYSEWQNLPVLVHSQVPPAEFDNHLQLLKHEL